MAEQRRRIVAWARSVRREHEAIVVMSLARHERWRLYLAVAVTSPRSIVRFAWMRYRRWTVLPGDNWQSVQRFVVGVVVSVKPDRMLLNVASRELLVAHELGAEWWRALPPGCVPSYEWVDRDDWSWGP